MFFCDLINLLILNHLQKKEKSLLSKTKLLLNHSNLEHFIFRKNSTKPLFLNCSEIFVYVLLKNHFHNIYSNILFEQYFIYFLIKNLLETEIYLNLLFFMKKCVIYFFSTDLALFLEFIITKILFF